MDVVREFTYLGDRVSVGGGCEAAVTARTRCGWIMFRECGNLFHGKRFPLKLKMTAYKSCVSQTILYGCEVWYLRESEIRFLRRTEMYGESNV